MFTNEKKDAFYGFMFTENVFVIENCFFLWIIFILKVFSMDNIHFKGFFLLKNSILRFFIWSKFYYNRKTSKEKIL